MEARGSQAAEGLAGQDASADVWTAEDISK